MNNNINAHTILFTEDCPLDCRYCQLKLEDDYHQNPTQDFSFILEKVKKYVNEDAEKGLRTQLTFTGGEPFLYWEWINKIIDIYGSKINYHFNTCGYCFTEEILEKLSHYSTFFTLSIDGGEKLTNYMRPVRGNKFHVGYFQKIKQIAPILTYYFPMTVAKVIVNNRTVDLLYDTYLDLEQIGFQKIKFILDFNARPSVKDTKKEIQRLWEDKDTVILEEQLNLLLKELILRLKLNKNFMKIENMDNIIQFLLKDINTYSPDNLICNVFNGRTLSSLSNTNDYSCFQGYYTNLDDAYQALIQEYEKMQGKCPNDKECPAFIYCANTHCPISSLSATGTLFGSEDLECILDKVFYKFSLEFLDIANELCSESYIYSYYLNNFDYKNKEEIINGNLLSFK